MSEQMRLKRNNSLCLTWYDMMGKYAEPAFPPSEHSKFTKFIAPVIQYR